MFASDVFNDSVDQFNAVRLDKPCGNSYIPEQAKCRKGRGSAQRPESGEGKPQRGGGGGGKPQLSDKQKAKAIRKVAAERFKSVKSEKLRSAIKASKGNKSVEGRTSRKAAKRELFNRSAKTALQSALLGAPAGAYLESRRNKKRN